MAYHYRAQQQHVNKEWFIGNSDKPLYFYPEKNEQTVPLLLDSKRLLA
jgi:hypothetical protein